VTGKREGRGREAFDRVARFARAAIEAPGKLSRMSIAVAIGAKLMSDLLFEIAAAMALLAPHVHVLAAQRKIRQIMIETIARHAFPSLGAVAAYAVLAESAVMRILMARHAVAKIQAGKFRKRCDFFIADFCLRRLFTMALHTCDLLMPAGQRKLGPLVRKLRRRFPRIIIMAALAILSKLAAMLIAVTTGASLLQTKKCFGKLNIFVAGKIFLDEFRLMAIATMQRAMLTEKIETGLCMIEIRFPGFPKNQRKIFTAMFLVADHAILFLLADGKPVKAGLLLDALFDAHMASLTFRIAQLFAKLMARDAKADAFQLAMALRKRPGRNLRAARHRRQRDDDQC
jgi:hypothetical protein